MKSLDELTTRCIRCGFCLESCPTYQLTGEETESPRGRIYLARSADEGQLDWEAVAPHLDRCLGCRACETACPSGVEYGEILEIARHRRPPTLAQKALLTNLTSPSRLKSTMALSKLLPGKRIPTIVSKLLSGQSPEADRPLVQPADSLPPLDESSLPAIRGEVYLLEGCAMRVLFPRAHDATRRLLRRIGFVVRPVDLGCCGALHRHAGLLDEARDLALVLAQRAGDDLPIIVNSAGCGSAMKSTADRETSIPQPPSSSGAQSSPQEEGGFRSRVFDASEFLYANGLVGIVAAAPGIRARATYHDACHLAHGQGIRNQPRELLRAIPGLELVELNEADTCCGSAGIYNLTQPQIARRLLEQKWANIEATDAEIVAMSNPGCHAWIAQAAREHRSPIRVMHTMELLEAAFVGLDRFQ